MSRQERRYRANKIARKRWIGFHDHEHRWFGSFERHYPELGIYRKWNGSHGRCVCGNVRKWTKKNTNIFLRNLQEEIPSGGFYKKFYH